MTSDTHRASYTGIQNDRRECPTAVSSITPTSENFANPPGSSIDTILGHIPIPRMVSIKRTFERPVLGDAVQSFRERLHASGVLKTVRAGMSIAVGTGSRGITNLPRITRALLDELKNAGAKPFIFPAMGSHGGATAAGQRAVLERMGFTETSMGVPIRATMDVVQVGKTASGLPAYFDAIAADADGIVLVNRIKPHTSFRGKVESGLSKMIVIGLGKQHGAEICHNLGLERMEESLLALASTSIATGKILFGVGLIENAYHETCRVEVLLGKEILETEPSLLNEARRLLPRLAIRQLDVLIIDEVGKDIAGTGFDTNFVGRYPTSAVSLTSDDPQVTRIAVLDVTAKSGGNCLGLGMVDFTTERVFRKFSFTETYPNLLTSTTVKAAKIPMVLRNDRQAIQAAIKTCFVEDPRRVRLGRIKNTLEVDRMDISENILEEAQGNAEISTVGEASRMQFIHDGNLF